ncbi:MAG: methionyl-tRNA formyltransferase [bacterium]
MRLVFFGSSDFSCPSLDALVQSHHQVEMVITQPDRPKGRGQHLYPSPVKVLAQKAGLRVEQPEKASRPEGLALLRQAKPDIAVVVAYGQILSKSLLSIPLFGCVNVHGSLLPRHRGASPIQWAIIEGDEKTGVTTIQMDEGMDTGDILLQKEIIVLPEDTAGTLFEKLARLGAEALIETLALYEQGKIIRSKQDDTLATYTKLLKKENGIIDWNQPADRICRLIRGLNPWPGAFSYLNGRRIKVLQAQIIDEKQQGGDVSPGQIRRANRREGLIVEAGQKSALAITRLQPEGKQAMAAWEYFQGIHAQELEGQCGFASR